MIKIDFFFFGEIENNLPSVLQSWLVKWKPVYINSYEDYYY